MNNLTRKLRYYYWLVTGFFKKYSQVVIVVCVAAFFLLFVLRSLSDTFWFLLNPNKQRWGVMVSGNKAQIPLTVLQKISLPIVVYNAKGELKPGLCERWEMNNEGSEFTFYFAKDLKWSDGTPFTVKTIDINDFNIRDIKVDITKPYELHFTLPKPLVNFPSLLTVPLLKDNLVGIKGNYRIGLVKYDSGQLSSLNLVPLVKGSPILSYFFYNSSSDLILAYKLGEIDYFNTTDETVAKTFRQWRNTKVTESIDYKKIVTLFINTAKAPLDNVNIRQALAQLIDYTKLEMRGKRAYSPIVPFSWAYDSEVKQYSFEPEIGKSLVEKNNAEGKPLSMASSYDLNTTAEILNKNFVNAGLKSEIRYVPYIPADFDLFLVVFEPNIDPDQYAFWHQSQMATNLSKLKNVKIDKVLEDGRGELSQTKRKQIYYKFQELMLDELPAIFLYHPKQYLISRIRWLGFL